MKRSLYAIPSLLVAGLMPVQSWSAEDVPETTNKGKSFLDNLGAIVSDISETRTYTMAQHSSHVSHISHQSHQSGFYAPPMGPGEGYEATSATYREDGGRNEMSTPRSTILPSSPAIAKKVKILPGNSKKFKDIVSRLQITLLSRGYDVGEINGEVDAKTIAAIYQYQSRSGLIPTGRITDVTLGSLGLIAQ